MTFNMHRMRISFFRQGEQNKKKRRKKEENTTIIFIVSTNVEWIKMVSSIQIPSQVVLRVTYDSKWRWSDDRSWR